MSEHLKGLLITAMGVMFVVPDSLFIRLIDANALVISFWRGMIVGVVLGLWILMTRGAAPFRSVLGTGRCGLVYAFAVGVSAYLFTLAVKLTSVANVVFIIAAMPVFAAIYSRVFLKEPISPRMVLTMIGVAIGMAIIAYGSGETENAWWGGDLVALLVAATFAAGLTAARKVRGVSMVPAVPFAYFGTGLVILPFIDPFSVPADQWWLVGMHGSVIVVSAVGLALGPRYIPSAEVALLILLESILAPLLVWAVIGENPGPWALLGGAIVIGALFVSNAVVLMRGPLRSRSRPPADPVP